METINACKPPMDKAVYVMNEVQLFSQPEYWHKSQSGKCWHALYT